MLYYTILYYTVLYYTILYYTILYYTILYYTITILYYTILYYTILILYYTILYYTILYYTTLYYTLLYYTLLYYTNRLEAAQCWKRRSVSRRAEWIFILCYTTLHYTITILYNRLEAAQCEQESGGGLRNCPVQGGASLTVHGRNFGLAPIVWIGTRRCGNVSAPTTNEEKKEEEEKEEEDIAICTVPAGIREVVVQVQQANGMFSSTPKSLSYVHCPVGTYLNESGPRCVNCPPGKATPQIGQYDCAPCGPTEFAPDEGMGRCEVCTDYDLHASATPGGRFCHCNAGFVALFLQHASEEAWQRLLAGMPAMKDSNRLGFCCVPCPKGANCLEPGTSQANIQALPGYFRGTDGSNSTFYPCFNNACLGNDQCFPGYGGAACTTCNQGYVSDGSFGCSKCLRRGLLIPFSAVFCLALALICALYVRHLVLAPKSLTDALCLPPMLAPKSLTDALVKIALSGVQVNILALGYQFQWESYFRRFLKLQSEVATIGIAYLKLDCFVHFEQYSLFFATQLFFLVVPIVLFLLLPVCFVLLLELLLRPCRVVARRGSLRSSARDWLVVTVVILAFLLFPLLSQRFLMFFSCQRLGLGEETYLSADMSIKCWSRQHVLWTVAVGGPMLVLYVIGIPVGGFVILRRGFRSGSLESAEFFRKYGFLYHGYRLIYEGNLPIFAWDVATQLRKLLVMAIGVFFIDKVEVASMLAMLVLSLALVFQIDRRPFADDLLNVAEVCSLSVSLFTFYLGTFSAMTSELMTYLRPHISIMSLCLNALFLLGMARLWWRVRVREQRVLTAENTAGKPNSPAFFGANAKHHSRRQPNAISPTTGRRYKPSATKTNMVPVPSGGEDRSASVIMHASSTRSLHDKSEHASPVCESKTPSQKIKTLSSASPSAPKLKLSSSLAARRATMKAGLPFVEGVSTPAQGEVEISSLLREAPSSPIRPQDSPGELLVEDGPLLSPGPTPPEHPPVSRLASLPPYPPSRDHTGESATTTTATSSQDHEHSQNSHALCDGYYHSLHNVVTANGKSNDGHTDSVNVESPEIAQPNFADVGAQSPVNFPENVRTPPQPGFAGSAQSPPPPAHAYSPDYMRKASYSKLIQCPLTPPPNGLLSMLAPIAESRPSSPPPPPPPFHIPPSLLSSANPSHSLLSSVNSPQTRSPPSQAPSRPISPPQPGAWSRPTSPPAPPPHPLLRALSPPSLYSPP
eukprot:g31318.t1